MAGILDIELLDGRGFSDFGCGVHLSLRRCGGSTAFMRLHVKRIYAANWRIACGVNLSSSGCGRRAMKAIIAGAAISLMSLATATAQVQTNCFTTGYGQQQHIWCSSTDNSAAYAYRNQAQANFSNSLAAAIAEKRARDAEAKAQQESAVYQALNQHDCMTALAIAGKNRKLVTTVADACAAPQKGE